MTMDPKIATRLQFLIRVVRKECRHLVATDVRLFGGGFSHEQVARLESDPDLAERVGLIDSVDEWITMRSLRNQMVYEYVEDPLVLESPLRRGLT